LKKTKKKGAAEKSGGRRLKSRSGKGTDLKAPTTDSQPRGDIPKSASERMGPSLTTGKGRGCSNVCGWSGPLKRTLSHYSKGKGGRERSMRRGASLTTPRSNIGILRQIKKKNRRRERSFKDVIKICQQKKTHRGWTIWNEKPGRKTWFFSLAGKGDTKYKKKGGEKKREAVGNRNKLGLWGNIAKRRGNRAVLGLPLVGPRRKKSPEPKGKNSQGSYTQTKRRARRHLKG